VARPRKALDEWYVIESYEAGHTLQAIADQLGVDRCVVTRVVKDAEVYEERRGAHWSGKRLRKRQSAESDED
jgi:hypothetical protein